jgi:hypothetical protein
MSDRPIIPRGIPAGLTRNVGHAHFWERLRSRRRFLQTAGAAGLALGSGLWLPTPAWADDNVDPKPIPDTRTTAFGTINQRLPGPADMPIDVPPPPFPSGGDPSLITDFNGFVGVIEASGTGTGTDTTTGTTTPLFWAADNRFMTGVYVGVDGEKHQGTFAFV